MSNHVDWGREVERRLLGQHTGRGGGHSPPRAAPQQDWWPSVPLTVPRVIALVKACPVAPLQHVVLVEDHVVAPLVVWGGGSAPVAAGMTATAGMPHASVMANPADGAHDRGLVVDVGWGIVVVGVVEVVEGAGNLLLAHVVCVRMRGLEGGVVVELVVEGNLPSTVATHPGVNVRPREAHA